MYKEEIAKKANTKFSVGVGRDVDVLYATSDGELTFSTEEAEKHIAIKKLGDKEITPYYRDGKTREIAQRNRELYKIIVATDYLKLYKLKRQVPLYQDYVSHSQQMGVESVPETLFDFIKSKVFSSRALTTPGLRDTIYMHNKGIVEAHFMRAYPQGKVWQMGDYLVLTCPTHTELMSGTYQQIFGAILAPEPIQKEQRETVS